MATTFTAAIANPDVGVRFYLYIEGIPHIFIDGAKPVGPNNGAWAAPTSGGRSYAIKEHMLDVSNGVKDVGPEISRRTGEVSPSSMTVTLQENRAGDLLDIMAREKSDGALTNLDTSFGYDTGGGPTTIGVEDTSDFGTGVTLYFGRETIYATGKTDATFTGLTRNLFDVDDGASNTYGDTKYVHNEDLAIGQGFSTITDYPAVWHGRHVRLIAFIVGPDGRAYDTAFDGSASREIWRGIIQGNPRPLNDWQRWALRCVSIESILQTEVGRDSVQARLIKYPGGAKANNEGWKGVDGNGDGIQDEITDEYAFTYYMDDNTRFLDIRIFEYANVTDYENGTTSDYQDLTGADRIALNPSPTLAAKAAFTGAFNDAIETAIDAALTNDDLKVQFVSQDNEGRWRIQVWSESGRVYKVQFLFDIAGSVGPLLSYSGSPEIDTFAIDLVANDEPLAVYIHPDSLVIPFYYAESEGINPDTAPASGFARIGNSEVVEYTSITDVGSSQSAGLFQMNVKKRGAMHTSRTEHKVRLNPDWTTDAEDVKIIFGYGIDGDDPITAVLKLAVSTGDASHHTTYDTLPYGISAPLNPNHFDIPQWENEIDQLPGPMQAIRYFSSKTQSLSSLMSMWFAPFGYYVYGGVNADGKYLIQLGQVLPPLESEANTTVGTSVLDLSDPAQYEAGVSRVVNQIKVNYRWDNAREKQLEDSITVNAYDSQREYGTKGKLTWNMKGLGLDGATAVAIATDAAYGAFARFARVYDVFRLSMDRTGWDIEPGDVVDLTLPGAPNTSGTRGFTNVEAVVLQCTKTYQTPMGAVEATGAEVLVILEPHTRQTTYSPSGKVASKSGSDITLEANHFTKSGFSTDAAHFAVNDVIIVMQAGDFSTREVKTIQSISGNVLRLNSAVTLTVGTSTYIVPDDYAAVVADQRKHAFIADNSDPAVLSAPGDTDAYNYI